MMELIERIMRIPIALLKDDYQNLFLDFAKKIFNQEYSTEPIIDSIIKAYDARSIMNLYRVALDDFTINSFDSDIRFFKRLYYLFTKDLS